MNIKTKWAPWFLVGFAALLVALGAAIFYSQTTQAAEDVTDQAITTVARWTGMGRHGRWGAWNDGQDTRLAEALGITTDELAEAREQAQAAAIAAAVEAGEITQEEADLFLARQALRKYQVERAQAEFEEFLAQAVEDGAITQEQADLLQSQEWGFGRGPGRGFGAFGRHGMGRMDDFGGPRGHGMMGGPRFGR